MEKPENINIIQDVSTLYELSLAIGKSLDVEENCRNFLNVLMARRNFSFCSVWVHRSVLIREQSDQLELIYASPLNQINRRLLPEDHYIWQALQQQDYLIIDSRQAEFSAAVHEQAIQQGSFVCYRLGQFGYLKLYISGEVPFSRMRAAQMVSVMNRFAFQLKGCFAHELLIKETDTRKTVQRALNISEEKYRTVVRNLSEGIVITDLDGVITFTNDQMARISGYHKEELIGNVAFDLLTNPEEAHRVKQKILKRKQGESEEYIIEHIRKDGSRWFGKIKASPYTNDQGEVTGTMGIVSDITAQVEAEQKIVESEQKFRKVIDTSLDAVVAIDESGMVTEWNQQAEAIFGYSRVEAMGQSMGELIVPEQYRQSHQEGMQRFLKTGEGPVLNNRIEITALDKAGREFPIELSISSIKIKGRYTFSAFMRDITERNRANEELLAAKQAAEQAHKAEQQFLATMSHEIRTPMNAVIGMTHLLYETRPSEAQKEYLDALQFSADSLMGIITNILDLSKIEAGELEFEKRTFNLVELLKGLQQTFQFKVREKPVSVDIDIDPAIKHHLVGDSVRLNQILTNLLGNASKFTQRGTIGVRARILARSGQQCTLQFQIHDTGIGIDIDQIDRIFENFKQAEVGITRKFGGTGLGLAIVKQLVELQGGTITVESQKAKGSTFTVILPFDYSKVEISEPPLPEVVDEDHRERIQLIKILIVEDNPMNQKLISKIMDLWKCNYEIAASGHEALQMTRERLFDLILMDIHMPEMDGCETTILIRDQIDNPNHKTPIIALTAAALLDEKNRALNAGMNDFLTKPIAPQQLKQMILKWGGKENEKDQVLTSVEYKRSERQEQVKIDLSYLQEVSKADEHFMEDMIRIFLKEIPIALEQLKSDCKAEDWSQVCNIAHRIKSNYMMVGMHDQQEVALRIEKRIKTGEMDPFQIQIWINQLRTDSKLAYPQLKEALGELLPATGCPITGSRRRN